jgi:hypothetical protein
MRSFSGCFFVPLCETTWFLLSLLVGKALRRLSGFHGEISGLRADNVSLSFQSLARPFYLSFPVASIVRIF